MITLSELHKELMRSLPRLNKTTITNIAKHLEIKGGYLKSEGSPGQYQVAYSDEEAGKIRKYFLSEHARPKEYIDLSEAAPLFGFTCRESLRVWLVRNGLSDELHKVRAFSDYTRYKRLAIKRSSLKFLIAEHEKTELNAGRKRAQTRFENSKQETDKPPIYPGEFHLTATTAEQSAKASEAAQAARRISAALRSGPGNNQGSEKTVAPELEKVQRTVKRIRELDSIERLLEKYDGEIPEDVYEEHMLKLEGVGRE